jgi:outer membrane protein insertion porin family
MRYLPTPFSSLTLALLLSVPAISQAQPVSVIADIQVKGASDLISSLVKINLPLQVGDPLSSVNLTAVQLAVFNQGFFQKVSAELQDVGGKTILLITVIPNSDISSLEVKSAFIAPERIKAVLDSQLNIAPGATFNGTRVEQSKEDISKAYRDGGFPFTPRIIIDVIEEKDGAKVTYTVEESVPITKLELPKSNLVTADEIQSAFAPMMATGAFDYKLYLQGIQGLAKSYSEKGYTGSGLDVAKSTLLEGGVLKLELRELKIANLNIAPLGKEVALQIKTGDLFNLKNLGDEVSRLDKIFGQAIEISYLPTSGNAGGVDVTFSLSAQAPEKIEKVVLKGSGTLDLAELQKLLRLKAGDPYNQQLAEDDYYTLQKAYRDQGYELSTNPNPLEFENGVLTLNLREVKISGYEFKFKGSKQSQDRTLLRELPEAGSLFNVNKLRKGIENLIRTGLVNPPQVNIKPSETDPNNLIVVLETSETSTLQLIPQIQFSTQDGWNGNLVVGYTNLWGLAHQVNLQVTAGLNDAGQNLSGSLSYSIPWLDIPFLDFNKVRTSVSTGVSSNVAGNLKLVDSSQSQVDGREYTQRSTGADFSVSRPIGDYLSLGVSANYAFDQNYLENLDTTKDYTDRTATDGTKLAPIISFLPKDGQTTLLSTGLSWDNTNNPEFPTKGVRADGNVGFGLGNAGDLALGWTKVSSGFSTYFGFGDVLQADVNQQVVAFRVNAGTLLGTAPSSRLFSVGGSDVAVPNSFTIHGYDTREFTGTSFVTFGAEYRFNLNVSAGIAQGLYLVAFADGGDAWKDRDFKAKLGGGVGAQLNLGFGGARLPALRFDYAFSEKYPQGKFYFRLGNFF